MSKRTVQFSIYRYDPDKDDAPYMQEISVDLEPTDRKLLDALTKLKAKDDFVVAMNAMKEAAAARTSGDWSAYGQAQDKLNQALQAAVQAQEALGQSTSGLQGTTGGAQSGASDTSQSGK